VRGLARRALILTPASLVVSGRASWRKKFFERFDARPIRRLAGLTKAIVSHGPRALAPPRRGDPAHHWDLVSWTRRTRSRATRGATYQFIEKIERDFFLLLTATPLQNDLRGCITWSPTAAGTARHLGEFAPRTSGRRDHRQRAIRSAAAPLTHEVGLIRTRRSRRPSTT